MLVLIQTQDFTMATLLEKQAKVDEKFELGDSSYTMATFATTPLVVFLQRKIFKGTA